MLKKKSDLFLLLSQIFLDFTEACQHTGECWLQLLVSLPPYIFAACVTSPRVIFSASERMLDMHVMKNWISIPQLNV